MGPTETITFIIGILKYLFDKLLQDNLYKDKILYNTAWEDPSIDIIAMGVSEKDNIVMITSGGCKVFMSNTIFNVMKVMCWLTHSTTQIVSFYNTIRFIPLREIDIYSIDRNICQNALLELKIAAIKELDYEDFWQIFGEGRVPQFSKQYYPRLRKHLSLKAQQFWDSHTHYFDGNGYRNSFYYRGCCGFLAWALISIS
jgi:S-adenosylmethionine-diacylglycerol 3-amino-3-carboxypropyl transferase